MRIKPELTQSLTYIVTAALLLYQFFWELSHCCREGQIFQELMKFFTEGWIYLLLLLSGSLLLISGFLRLKNRKPASVMALIATLIGLVYYIFGIWVFLVYLFFIFTNVEALIFILSGVMLLVSLIISTREVIMLFRNRG